MPYSDISSYLKALPKEFQAMAEEIRKVIKSSDKRLKERIKWNAPSYYHINDIVTFGPIRKEKMVLVFHHPSVVKIKSPLLEGNYKDRRLVWFKHLKEVKTANKELVKIMKFILLEIDKKHHVTSTISRSILKVCTQGHSFYKSSDCPVCPKCESIKKGSGFLSDLAAPARRALENEGILSIKALSKYKEKEILQLHGVGPGSIPKLKEALKTEGLKFK